MRHDARYIRWFEEIKIEDLAEGIVDAYRSLGEQYGENTDVAVRSSATAEDLPTGSFCGSAGYLPQYPGRRTIAGCLSPLLCLPLY